MRVRITINGHVYEADVEVLEDGQAPAAAAPNPQRAAAAPAPAEQLAAVPPPDPGAARRDSSEREGGGIEVRAALPGVVSEVRVARGQRVTAGEVLLVLEAMKMDNDVTAPRPGTVRSVLVAPGDQVAAQQLLAILED
jgi:biotin carboxyl carrier protein